MSTLSVISSMDPVSIELDDKYTLVIRAGYNGTFAVCVSDKTGKYVDLPEDLEVYEIYNQRYWDEPRETNFLSGPASDVYEIYYKNEPVLENIERFTMDEYCGFNCASNMYKHNFYTALCKATVSKGSNAIKVSSTMDIDVGVTVSGEGIPEFSTVTHVDDNSNTIQIKYPAHASYSNMTLTVR